jgi:hypothetical protein
MGISPLYLESGTWLRNVLVSLGFPAIYIIGYGLVYWLHFRIEDILKMLLAGLSIFVLINVLYTLFRYLPLYRLHYAGQVIYVDGEMYAVAEEVKWLIGITFYEVNIAYMDLYITILLMPLFAHLKYVFDWKNWQKHLWWWLPTLPAIIAILFLPRFLPLVYAGLIYAGWLLFSNLPKWWKKYPLITKRIVYAFAGFVGLMVGLFFIEAFDLFGIGTFIKGFRPLATILDFPLIEGYQAVLRSVGQFPFGGFAPLIVNGRNLVTTGSIVFDTLHQAGIFALVGLLLIGVFFSNQLYYFNQDKKIDSQVKQTFIFMVTAFMIVQIFATQLYPFVREDRELLPRLIIDEPLWMMMFLLMGMIMIDPFKGWISAERKLKKASPKSNTEKALRKEKSPSNSQGQWRVVD